MEASEVLCQTKPKYYLPLSRRVFAPNDHRLGFPAHDITLHTLLAILPLQLGQCPPPDAVM